MLTAEELLAGAEMTHEISIPDEFLSGESAGSAQARTVRIRPLSIGTFQLIMKGASEDPGLIPILMVKEGLAEPKLTVAQVRNMPIGLLEFILEQIREKSGITKKKTL